MSEVNVNANDSRSTLDPSTFPSDPSNVYMNYGIDKNYTITVRYTISDPNINGIVIRRYIRTQMYSDIWGRSIY